MLGFPYHCENGVDAGTSIKQTVLLCSVTDYTDEEEMRVETEMSAWSVISNNWK